MNRLVLFSLTIAIGLLSSTVHSESSPGWSSVDGEMSDGEYGQAVKNNQRFIGKLAEQSVVYGLSNIGVAEEITTFSLSAVGAAVNGGEIPLNAERSIYLELNEPAGDSPDASLKFRYSW